MEEWIKQIGSSDITSITVLPAAFVLGILGAFASCCSFAVIGAVVSYSGTLAGENKRKTLIVSCISFFIGTILSLGIIGGLTGLVSNVIIASIGNYWKIAAGIVLIFLGVGTLNWLPFKLPSVSISNKSTNKGVFAALLFGLAIGGISTACNACCNPLFPLIISASFLKGGFLWGSVILLTFAIGYSLPLATAMMGLGLGIGKLTATASKISSIITYIAGFVLLIIGFYFLLTI